MIAGLALLRNPEMLLGEGVATALHRRKHAHSCLTPKLVAIHPNNFSLKVRL